LGHDIPHLIESERGRLIELPSDMTLDDWTQYVCSKDLGNTMPIASPTRATEVFRAEFDAAWRHGACGSLFGTRSSPGGSPAATRLIGLIEYMQAKGGRLVSPASTRFADHVRACIDGGGWTTSRGQAAVLEAPLTGVPSGRTVRVG